MQRAFFSRPNRLLLVAILGVSFSFGFAANADKPAVKQINGRVFGGYDHARMQSDTVTDGASTAFLPAERDGRWKVGGVVTFPITYLLGGRVIASGGMNTRELEAGSGFAGSRADGSQAMGGVDFFLRDPDSSFLGLGYRFGWQDPTDFGVDQSLTNSILLDAGFYIPDQGLGPIDWSLAFVYGRSKLSGPGFSDDVNEYMIDATSGWYWTESFRFTAGFHWSLEDPIASLAERDIRGTADLAWLLPFGQRRFVTAEFKASGGKIRSDLAAPLSFADRAVWSVGGALTFSYPGATSLIELTRELH